MQRTHHLIPGALVRHLLGRGVILWGLTRATVGALVVGGGGSALAIGVGATLGTIVLGGTLGLVESRRSREGALLSNLALSRAHHMALLLFAGACGEVVLRAVTRAF